MDIKTPPFSQTIIEIKTREMFECTGFIANIPLPYSIPKNKSKNQNVITTPVHVALVAIDLRCGEGAITENDTVMLCGTYRSEVRECPTQINRRKNQLKISHFANSGVMLSGQLSAQMTLGRGDYYS